MKRCLSGVLVLGSLALAGCSKVLTESSAVGVIQKYIDAQAGGQVSTFAGALTNQVSVEMSQRWTAVGVQRVIKEGFLQEKTVPVSYPNFSGTFTGRRGSPGGPGGGSNDSFSDFTNAGQPPYLNGSFRTCNVPDPSSFYRPVNDCSSGNVSGPVQRNGGGPSNFTLVLTNPSPYAFGTMPNSRVPFQASLIRGNPDVIQVNLNGHPIRLEGHVTGPDVQQGIYIYNWTAKLPKDLFVGPFLKLGHLVVESCDHLLLGTETTASATCKTHVKLTKEAEIIFGRRPTNQSVQAAFGKQPDGNWIATQIGGYVPPQYNIFQ